MRKAIKVVLFIAGMFAIAAFALVGGFLYITEFKEVEVGTYQQAAGPYSLRIYQVGKPDWPFGKTDCRMVLFDGSNRVEKLDFDVHNDGCFVSESNFSVQWSGESVTVVARGEEQLDAEYTFELS